MTGKVVNIIGGGFAGMEASLTLAKYGVSVHLFDVETSEKREYSTFVSDLANELCIVGASLCPLFKENDFSIIKEKAAFFCQKNEKIKVFSKKVGQISLSEPTIIATGSETTDDFFNQLQEIFGKVRCHTHQPVFPIFEKIEGNFQQINEKIYLPISKDSVLKICEFLKTRPYDPVLDCLEKWANIGPEMLKAKVLRPVMIGSEIPYGALQFKKVESGYMLINFHTALSEDDQLSLFKLIDLIKNSEVVRFGGFKKCTFIAPNVCLNSFLQSQSNPNLFLAGRLIMVEGELEAIATGHLAALNVLNYLQGRKMLTYPENTILGMLTQKIFSREMLNLAETKVSCDIIEKVDKIKAEKLLKNFKEAFDARISWHNNLCSQKKW